MRKILALIFLVLMTCTIESYAGIYGTLKGKVVDQDGKPVIGATIRIMGTVNGTYVKDSQGKFTIVKINSGTYTVKVSAVGFTEKNIREVTISADKTTTLNITISSTVIQSEGVTVTADAIMVKKDDIGTNRGVNSRELTGVARESVQSIVGLSAGVSTAGNGFNIRGARSSETQIRVDGLDVGNQFTGGFGSGGSGYFPMVSVFATEEVQVLTGGFSAEYGDALGGVVNTIVKSGSTERYEGLFRWRTDFEPLWGSQRSGIQLVQEGAAYTIEEAGEGKKAIGQEQNTFDFGFGGPLPFLDGSTFHISGNYLHENYRSSSYEIFDPDGNNISRRPNNQTWVKNITGRVKYSLNKDISMIFGGMFGMTNWENASFGWFYADDPAIFYDTVGTEITQRIVNIPENAAKQPVGNQLVSNLMARINHTLGTNAFYEFTVSRTSNSDEAARRIGLDDPGFFTGFDFLTPVDNLTVDSYQLVPGKDQVVDYYTPIGNIRPTSDGYFENYFIGINPLTGYYESSTNASGTDNAWGRANAFVTHGNSGFSYRNGSYWQVDGNLTYILDDGDFTHNFKTGFEYRYYTQERHYNGNPTVGDPFFDVYSDDWGGNIYTDNPYVYEKTSVPYHPVRASFYMQDQIEFKGVIISPGVRFDYFDPNSQYRLPSKNFTSFSADTGFADAEAKFNVSPRINVTYPITERSTISLAYGIFYKIPELQTLYDGFGKELLRGNEILGEPNMDVQRTNFYQVSYNNQLTDDFALDVTAYYRDVYNQLGIKYVAAVPDPYSQYDVAEYGNSRGIEFTFRKRPSGDHFYFQMNYTLASTKSTSSSAGSNYNRATDPYTGVMAYPLTEYPNGNDIRHRVNLILSLIWGDGEGPTIGGINLLENTVINLSGFWRSGSPYTRTDLNGRALSEINAERQPSFWTADLRLSRRFMLRDYFGESAGRSSLEIFVDVKNLLNRTEPVAVYSATGDPDDNGTSLAARIGSFSPVTFYKDPSFAIAETISSQQYDRFGDRLYDSRGDIDGNGAITQEEKYLGYINYLETAYAFRGNYQFPRTVYFGLMFNF